MNTLYLIVQKFGAFLLFFFLEIICIYFIVSFNEPQRLVYLSSTNYFSGNYHNLRNSIEDYFNLDKVADDLAEENALLRDQLEQYKSRITVTHDTLRQDSLRQAYHYISASVIKNSINLPNNMITINKGSKDGIKNHMGVITDKGVVGIVRKTGKRYALVMSVLNRATIINAKIKDNGYFGPMVWEEQDSKTVRLKDIPVHAEVEIGDTVQTTGYSSIFPTDINIGVVDTTWKAGSNSYTIFVRLFEDLANLQYVYVVNYLEKAEIETLENELRDEQK
ncbi:MAG: rod shape-determining protein MreC [Bacteroidota bacterium]